jgi:hypothetical protein
MVALELLIKATLAVMDTVKTPQAVAVVAVVLVLLVQLRLSEQAVMVVTA